MQLNQLLAAPGFGAWLEGEPLDIDRAALRRERPAAGERDLDRASRRPGAHVLRLAAAQRDRRLDAQPARHLQPARAGLLRRDLRLPAAGREPAVEGAAAHDPEAGARVRPGPDRGHAESRRPGLQGAGQRRHVDARPAADRARQGARARRPRRRGGGIGRRFDRADMDRLLSALGKRQFLLHNVHDKGTGRFRNAMDALVSSRAARTGRDQEHSSVQPRFQRCQTCQRCRVPHRSSGSPGIRGTWAAPGARSGDSPVVRSRRGRRTRRCCSASRGCRTRMRSSVSTTPQMSAW